MARWSKINEDIIATVFYYHDSENIGDSKISFRNAAVSPNVTVVDGDRVMARRVFRFKDQDKLTRFPGSVDCIDNRL